MVERHAHNVLVIGSSPIASTNSERGNNMILFIVKTIHVIETENGDKFWSDSSDAVYFDAQSAYDIVRFNYSNLSDDGYNQYVVILTNSGGIYPTSNELVWYKWNEEINKYEECDRPDFMGEVKFSL